VARLISKVMAQMEQTALDTAVIMLMVLDRQAVHLLLI
jgi:hypothetical protein